MEYRELGRTGVTVSRIALGCGNFGGVGSAPELFGHGESEEDALALMDAAWEMGVTLFDTADAYGGGRSEAAIGRWLADRGRYLPDGVVVATKVFNSVTGDPGDRGLAPDRIRRQVEGSLARLGVERLALYLVHEPDPETPIVETLRALDGLVRAGKVGAIGASNADAPWLEGALAASDAEGLVRFDWVQNSYSLLERGDEADVLPLCAAHGLGYTPFSPLAGGWLTGKYRAGEPFPPGSRMTLRPGPYEDLVQARTFRALAALGDAARARGLDTATLALAWVLAHPLVTSVIVGPRRPAHLEPARRALALELSQDERDELAGLFAA